MKLLLQDLTEVFRIVWPLLLLMLVVGLLGWFASWIARKLSDSPLEPDPFDQDYTEAQLDILRDEALDSVNPEEFTGFTCDACQLKSKCRYVYDGYNTNGDCLAQK